MPLPVIIDSRVSLYYLCCYLVHLSMFAYHLTLISTCVLLTSLWYSVHLVHVCTLINDSIIQNSNAPLQCIFAANWKTSFSFGVYVGDFSEDGECLIHVHYTHVKLVHCKNKIVVLANYLVTTIAWLPFPCQFKESSACKTFCGRQAKFI